MIFRSSRSERATVAAHQQRIADDADRAEGHHISETDRINHFLWEDYECDTPGFGRSFLAFYRTLDSLVGELLSVVPAGAEVVLRSGNGFRRLRREIYLNRALEERGWLDFEPGAGRRLGMIARDARAYSLAPGRVFLHPGRPTLCKALDKILKDGEWQDPNAPKPEASPAPPRRRSKGRVSLFTE